MTLRSTAATLAALALALSACGKTDDAAAPAAGGAPVPTVPAPAGKAWSEVVSENADGGLVLGNPDAPIKLLEYGSLSCPACAKFAQQSEPDLISKYVDSGRVSWEFRSFAIHPQDIPLTLLAKCGSKEAFFPLMQQIYNNFDAMNGVLEDPAVLQRAQAAMQLPPAQRFVAFADAMGYTQFFAQRGLAVEQARACLTDGAKAQAVADFVGKYSENGIESTPTMLVNGTKIDATDWPGVEVALQSAGAR